MNAAVELVSPELAGGREDGALATLRARLARRLAKSLATAPLRMRNEAPLVTFTFDDVPVSALTRGAALLESHGVAGTFYVSGGLLGRRTAWPMIDAVGVRALHRAGHEIGCHTYSHREAHRLDRAALSAEIARNAACLAAIVPEARLTSFAFPYGAASAAAKRVLAGHFGTSRGVEPALNVGTIDRHLLKAFPLVDAALGPEGVDRVLDDAAARRGWAIFYTHDVAEAPSRYGCTPGLLAHALAGARRRGLRPVTMAQGLALAGHPTG